jgi:hypothetical protein
MGPLVGKVFKSFPPSRDPALCPDLAPTGAVRGAWPIARSRCWRSRRFCGCGWRACPRRGSPPKKAAHGASGQGVARPPPSPYQSDARLSVSTGTLPGSHATPRPTRSAEALDLRVARERPAAAQAENVANAFGPPIDGVRRCPAVQMRHLSVFEDAVRAEEHRA